VVKKSRCSRQGDTITDALPTLQRTRKQIDSLNYLQDQEKRRYKRRKNVAQKFGSVLHETGKPTQNKTKQTMRQPADSPERGKATNRKTKKPGEKCSKTKDTNQKIRNK
jgi:phage-related minor tail protein